MAEGREFNVGLYLMSQLLSQFSDRSIESLSGNIGTFVCGPSDALAAQAAVDHKYIQTDAKRILGEVPVGDWLVSMTAPRGHMPFDPFVVGALPLPKGHPDSEIELTDAEQASCAEAIRDVYERSRSRPDVVTASRVRRRPNLATRRSPADSDTHSGPHRCLTASSTTARPIQFTVRRRTKHSLQPSKASVMQFVQFAETPRLRTSTCPSQRDRFADRPLGRQDCTHLASTAHVLRLIEKAQRRAIDSRAWDIVTQTMRPLRDEVGCTSADEAELKEMGLISLQDELRGSTII